MNLSPWKLLQEAIKAVPQLKFALGVAGLVAVVAIVSALSIRPQMAVFGAVTTLVLMVPLLVFAKLTRTAKPFFLVPALVLMWSFLLLVIATAGLLFTSSFFRWPMDFREGQRTNGVPTVGIEKELAAAQLQREGGDYEGAWQTLQNAAPLHPHSGPLLDAQADVAMAWLRHVVLREPQTFTEFVDRLTPTLYLALTKATGVRAGDLTAHIGWAAFLRSRDGPATADPDAQYRKAIGFDAQNPYAHAMLGHHLLQTTGQVPEARRHFDIAVAAQRDREWVRGMQLAALQWVGDDAHKLELVRVLNEMRKNGEPLAADERDGLFSKLYWFGAGFSYLTNLVHALPAAEHLATLNWLAGAEGWNKSWPQQKFVLASLKEQTGDWSAALKLYQGLNDLGGEYREPIKRSIARCQSQLPGN